MRVRLSQLCLPEAGFSMQLVRIILIFPGLSVYMFGGGLLYLRRQQQYHSWLRDSNRYDSPWFAGLRSKLDKYTYRLMFLGAVLILSSLALLELSGT